MSVSAVAIADPFEPAALDEETELMALTNALRLADGFRLFFVRCNQPNQRARLMAKLGLNCPNDAFLQIHFTEPVLHLLDAIRERLPASMPQAVFVSGLEYSLPVAYNAEHTAFIANLNAARNSFPSAVPCPLVLWLPEYALTAIVRGAPDFFSIRSGVYFFAASPEETAPLFNAVIAGNSWQFASFSLLEKQERVATIENLLQDYQALSFDLRDFAAESVLIERLGHLYLTLGYRNRAEQVYMQNLNIFREMGNRNGEGNTQNNLGIVYKDQGRLIEATQAYHQSLQIYQEIGDRKSEGQTLSNLGVVYSLQSCWTKAEQVFQQSLQIYRELGNRQGEGQTLGNLGNIYQVKGRWAEAEQTYQESLILKKELGDRHGEGQTLNNLGNVYKDQGLLTEAEQLYQQSLTIKQALGDKHGEGSTLGNLGNIYRQQGRLTEAEQFYQQSLQIYRELGDQKGEGGTLGSLALLKEAESDITGALSIGRAALEALRTTEDAALLKQIQEWVEEWEGQVELVAPL